MKASDTSGKRLTKVLVHFIFSTKNREAWIAQELERDLFAFIGGLCRALDGALTAAGGAEDHVHLLISTPKTMTLSDIMLHVKRDSSKWIKANHPSLVDFAWQEGYAAFSVGHVQIPEVRGYLSKQREHHRTRSFKEELVAFLRKYEVEFDDRYIWT